MDTQSNRSISRTTFFLNLTFFIACLLVLIGLREYGIKTLLDSGNLTYASHTYVRLIANLLIILLSLSFLKINGLFKVAGWGFGKMEKWYLLIFPLLYLPLVNYVFMDDMNASFFNIFLLLLYCISIGFSEELALRGVIQSYIVSYLGNDRKAIFYGVVGASIFFAILHLIKFDRGIYGEVSQVFFAFFIGSMFGMLLIVTKKLYPLIIIHALIDFVAKLDNAGIPLKETLPEPTSLGNSIASVLITLPCLIYAFFLFKKYGKKNKTK